MLILFWQKKTTDPFMESDDRQLFTDGDLRKEYLLCNWHLSNAIQVGELPALKKPRNKAFEKKLQERLNVPEDVREFIPKQHDYWVTQTDLISFVERPDCVSNDTYAHSREALASVAWLLARQNSSHEDSATFFEHLAQVVEDLNEDGVQLNLGETTLKGCIREILSVNDGKGQK